MTDRLLCRHDCCVVGDKNQYHLEFIDLGACIDSCQSLNGIHVSKEAIQGRIILLLCIYIQEAQTCHCFGGLLHF